MRRLLILLALTGCSSFGADTTEPAPDGGRAADGSADAAPSGPPCSDDLVYAGSNVTDGKVADFIPDHDMDLYGYAVQTKGIARCAHVWVEAAGLRAYVAVYDDAGGSPSKRLALALIQTSTSGWNAAPLIPDPGVDLSKLDHVWLGLLPLGNSANVRTTASCSPPYSSHSVHEITTNEPPATVSSTDISSPNCDLAAYIGP